MNFLQKELFKIKDDNYARFQRKLIPNIFSDKIIGVRVPSIRNLVKKIEETGYIPYFVKKLPHKYYEEDVLHAILISKSDSYETCLNLLKKFLPYIDNWAVCDSIRPSILKNYKNKLILEVVKWLKSESPYIQRFSINMLIVNYLGKDFKTEYLNLPFKIKTDEYYVNMAIAWFYASALVEHWKETIDYIENRKLSVFVHNKIIRKAKDSYRITKEQKEYLNSLRI